MKGTALSVRDVLLTIVLVCSAWASVFALVGEDVKGMVWPSEMPSEIAAEVERESKKRVNGAELLHLDAFRGVRTDRPSSQILPKRKSERPGAWDRPSYLRVVK